MSDPVWHNYHISKEMRCKMKNQKPCLLWFTGLSGAGKSTVAGALEKRLHSLKLHTYLLDGDNVRHGLNKDLGFTNEDRMENIRRIGEMSKLFVDAGIITISAFISPFASDRQMVRDLLEKDEFLEVYISTPLEVCEQRDPKGLYKKARSGEIKLFSGIDSPYEAPVSPDIEIDTSKQPLEKSVDKLLEFLEGSYIFTE